MITLGIIILIGLIISPEFREGVISAIAGGIVFTLVILFGVLFNIGYPLFMAIKERSVKLFFIKWGRLIYGTYYSIGCFLRDFAINLDILANVWGGEAIEDSITFIEKTHFGERVTISAAIGHLEHECQPIFKRGKTLSKVLNVAFQQGAHAVGSWMTVLAAKEIEDRDYYKKKRR